MKKLLAMVGAVALGAFAWADDVATYTGTDFETYNADEATTQTEDNLYYWLPSADEAATATVVEGVSTGTAIGEWSEGNDQKVLAIKTNLTKPLYRSVLGGESALSALSGRSMDDVVYFDAMVKFTACDEAVEIVENKLASDAQAKLAVWVLENVEDTDDPSTNLYVTAGYYNGAEMVATNYNCGPVSQYITSLDAFQRLTIRTIADATDGADIPGFVVFVNGTKVVRTTVCGVTFGKVARAFNKDGDGVFPSIDITSGDAAKICGVGFAGQGQVDDITFAKSDDSRDFAIPPKADEMVVTWTVDEVTALTLTHDGNSVTADDVSTGSLSIEITDPSKPVTIDATYADGKKAAYEWDAGVNCTVDATQSPAMATISSEWATGLELSCAIKTMSDYAGATIAGRTYPTLEEAFAYLNGSLATSADPVAIQLQNSLTTESMLVVEEGATADVVIDLNGQTLTGPAYDEESAITVVGTMGAGKLTITDSQTGGKIVATGAEDGQAAVYAGAGTLEILNGIFDGKVFVDDSSVTACTIAGGSFDETYNSTDDEPAKFALEGYIGDKVATLEDGYWVVAAPKTGSVIFVCEAAGVNEQVDDLKVGEVIPEEKIPTSAKSYLKITQWSEDLDSWKVVEGSTTIIGTADINLTVGGDGAYQVALPADLVTLKDYVADGNDCAGKTFKQTADIDLSSLENWPGIGGHKGAPFFKGIYDGDNKSFTGTLHVTAKSYGGLFSSCQSATFKNFTFAADIPTPAGDGDKGYAIIGYAVNGCRMINLTMSGTIGSVDNPCNHNVGGIIVSSEQTDSYFESCTMTGAIYTKGGVNDHVKAGGISALCNGGVNTFINCVVSGTIVNMTEYTQPLASNSDNVGTIAALCAYINGTVSIVDCDLSGATLTYKAPDQYVHVVAGSIAGYNHGATFVVTNTVADANVQSIGLEGNKASVKQLWFATINDGGKAVFDAANETLAAGNTYKVMIPGVAPAITLALNETITFVTNLCTATFGGVVVADDSAQKLDEVADANGVTFTCVAKSVGPTPIDPSDPKAVIPLPTGAGTADEFAATINDDPAMKAQLLADPTGVTFEDAERAAYQGYFKAAANAAGTGVTFVLNEAAVDADGKTLEEQVTAEVAEVLTTADQGTLSVKAVKGLYYGISQADSLGGMKVTESTQATDAAVAFTVDKSGNAGFYKIIVSATEIPVENAK